MKTRLLRIAVLAAVIVAAGVTSKEAHGIITTCRVWPSAPGPGQDGGTWATAYVNLFTALHQTNCLEIWVAAGVYRPGVDQVATFVVGSGVAVYGGFAGTEVVRSQRNPAANITVLSGDINGDDVNLDGNSIAETTADIVGPNSFHVVTMFSPASINPIGGSTVLDGFTITAGLADGDPALYEQVGAGLLCYGSGLGQACSPSLQNLTFSGNQAGTDTNPGFGGAIFADGSHGGLSSPILTSVLFRGNGASDSGGAMFNEAYSGTSSPVLTNVTFSGNHAARGGALYNNGLGAGSSSPILMNVTFSGNSATYAGGGILNEGTDGASSPILTNVILWGDTSGAATNPEMYNHAASPVMRYSLVYSGCAAIPGTVCGDGNLQSDPLLGALHNNGGSTRTMALITGSPAIDSGTNIGCPSTDQRGGLRAVDGNNDGTLTCDIGAVEYQGHLFADVPVTGKEWMEPWIDAFYYAGATTGCGVGPLIYCPENNVTRAEMAVFLLRAKHGYDYAPPPPVGYFTDVPVPGKEWMEAWIDQFFVEGVTTGCGLDPLRYCPEQNVTRAEMAVFVLRAIHTSGWTPPAQTGIFDDVPVPGKEWMQPWIEEFYRAGITTGCGLDPLRYCPENNTTRAEMAVFIDRAFELYP